MWPRICLRLWPSLITRNRWSLPCLATLCWESSWQPQNQLPKQCNDSHQRNYQPQNATAMDKSTISRCFFPLISWYILHWKRGFPFVTFDCGRVYTVYTNLRSTFPGGSKGFFSPSTDRSTLPRLTPATNVGYGAVGNEALNARRAGDIKEAFNLRKETLTASWCHQTGK